MDIMNDMNYGIGQSKFGALWVRSYSTITPYERIACHNKNFSVPSGPEEFYSEQKKCTQYLGIKTTTPNTNQNQKWQQQQKCGTSKKMICNKFSVISFTYQLATSGSVSSNGLVFMQINTHYNS